MVLFDCHVQGVCKSQHMTYQSRNTRKACLRTRHHVCLKGRLGPRARNGRSSTHPGGRDIHDDLVKDARSALVAGNFKVPV